MKLKYFAGLALVALAMTACDDTTESIGSSLASDGISIETDTFDVATRSIIADSVLSRNATGYLGKVRDPETGAYITGDFMAQFNSLENYEFPPLDSLVTYDAQGNRVFGSKGTIKVDSCEIRLFYSKSYGDTTQTMKITAYEMDKAMNEDRNYYSNFDPMTNGYVRKDGLHKDKVYNLVDYNVAKNKRDTVGYTPYINIKLNEAYTDKNGRQYNNYGSYVMQSYYDHPSYFKNAYTFRNNVVPGFFFKQRSGLGNMAYINNSQLNIYFKYKGQVAYTDSVGGKAVKQYRDTIYDGITVFWGTEEVLQTTTITNDRQTISQLAADESCTYLKTPAGLFTEMMLPVAEIMKGHEKDTVTSAKVTLQRINNTTTSNYAFDVPQTILMIPKDSLYSFFENGELYNNKNSYVATWSYKKSRTAPSYDNSYTFNNISGMISTMYHSYQNGSKSADWNKVVLVPVTLTTTKASSSSGTTTSKVTKVTNDMSLTSTRLVKGSAANSPIKISVIYSKFK